MTHRPPPTVWLFATEANLRVFASEARAISFAMATVSCLAVGVREPLEAITETHLPGAAQPYRATLNGTEIVSVTCVEVES